VSALKWTKADANRAAKMGWYLDETSTRITAYCNKFPSDREAAGWVMQCYAVGGHIDSAKGDYDTCRKALLLCALGGAE
jgi:DNA-binding SARP family transcriptional activator